MDMHEQDHEGAIAKLKVDIMIALNAVGENGCPESMIYVRLDTDIDRAKRATMALVDMKMITVDGRHWVAPTAAGLKAVRTLRKLVMEE